ncbi:MAG TPA: hypothetical protein VFG64_14975 [Dongiaceae bacterium]|nr:hypothetical protein [Dongiaceae bacterium]
MTKAIFHIRPIPQPLARSLSLIAIVVVLVLSVGGALAQRMEHRAEQDRLSFGDVTDQS